MNLHASHEMLVSGPDFATCCRKTRRFFERNLLVRYDQVQVVEAESVSAAHAVFWERLAAARAANREVLAGLLAELSAEGFRATADLMIMPQGYQSKILHTVAHLLDGFFGIDSRFYNLEEDSHGLTEAMQHKISTAPAGFWLIKVAASSGVAGQSSFIRAADINPH